MTETSESLVRPGSDGARSWTGHRLDEISGRHVGRVDGCFVAESSGEPEWVLARMGRFGHYTLLPARDAVEGAGHVWVPYTRDQIRRAPKIDPNTPLTLADERRLLEHYGVVLGSDRAGELAELADSAVSARPA